MLLNENFSRNAQKLLRTLLALNRGYFVGFGWIDELLGQLTLAPTDLADRYRAMWRLEAAMLAEELVALIEETYGLLSIHLPAADVEWLRRIFRYERSFWTAAPPGLLANVAGQNDDQYGSGEKVS